MMLQFITHQNERYSYLDSAHVALDGGCRWIQLRMKEASIGEIEKTALQVQALCKSYEATFLIDDQVELVKKIGADGVHVGKNDMPVSEVRKILGKEFIVGGTANTFEDSRAHYEAGASYIGCGPFRYTATKKNLSALLGLEGYRNIVNKMRESGIDLPGVAIGGITVEDIPAILETGITGVAISGSILNASDPVEETRKIMKTIL